MGAGGREFESRHSDQLVASVISLATSFFISLQSSSRAHSAAPRFQTGPAVAGLRFGAAAARRFCLPLKISILTVPSIKIATPAGCGYFYGNRGNLKCSAEVNSACAEVLPAAKHSYGAKAPPARRPVGQFAEPFRCFKSKCCRWAPVWGRRCAAVLSAPEKHRL